MLDPGTCLSVPAALGRAPRQGQLRLEQLLTSDQKAVLNINLWVRRDTPGGEQTGACLAVGREAE